MHYKIEMKDLQFEYFKRSKGAGGQKVNKTSSAVRLTHIPTSIVVESSDGRSQSDNKELAIAKLQAKLDGLAGERVARAQQVAYEAKPDSSFSAQIRTYRLCGKHQSVTDHRSGATHSNTRQVLDGDIDKFLKGNTDV